MPRIRPPPIRARITSRAGRSPTSRTTRLDHPGGRDDRVARMYDGLNELDRWLIDRMRTGLADPALAKFETWDALASRLVDARAGSLANRVRRLSGVVGASSDWHERVLDEIGLLHLLSQAGRRISTLPTRSPTVWRPRSAGRFASRTCSPGCPTPTTGSSPGAATRARTASRSVAIWLRGATTNRWALVLSFAAYRQSLDTSLDGRLVVPCRPSPVSRPSTPSARRRPVRRRGQRRGTGVAVDRRCLLRDRSDARAGTVARSGADRGSSGADTVGWPLGTDRRHRNAVVARSGRRRRRRSRVSTSCSPCPQAARSTSPSNGRRAVSCH